MTIDGPLDIVIQIAARIGLALLVLLIGRFIARLARRLARRLLERPHVAHALGPSLVRLISEAVYYVLFALALGLSIIALGVPATYVVGASAILLIIFAVALQQSLANFAATVIFLVFQPFRRDEWIETMGHSGTVQEILFFNTVIEQGDKKLVSLPNSKIQDSGIINYSRMKIVRVDVVCTVSYSVDLARVREVLNELAAGDKRIVADPAFAIVVDDLGENGVRLIVRPWVDWDDYWDVGNDLRERIKNRFDAEGIAFALPQRNIHLTGAAVMAEGDGSKAGR